MATGTLLEAAQRLMAEGKMQRAVEILTSAVSRNHDDPDGHSLLGIALSMNGQDEPAAELFRIAVGLDNGRASDWFRLGVIEERLGRSENARAAYETAVTLDPAHVHAKAGLARTSIRGPSAEAPAPSGGAQPDPDQRDAPSRLGPPLADGGGIVMSERLRICPECKRASSTSDQVCPCGCQFNGTVQFIDAIVAPAPASAFVSAHSAAAAVQQGGPNASLLVSHPGQQPPAQQAIGSAFQNSSGQRGDVPDEVSNIGWSWGAFGLGMIWLMSHGMAIWGIGWLTTALILSHAGIGGVAGLFGGLAASVVCGINGNKWAWQNRTYRDLHHFRAVEAIWANWGIGMMVAGLFCYSLSYVLSQQYITGR